MKYLVGIGNYTMSDDGVGPRIAEAVSERGLNEDFEVLDIGDNGLNLLSYFDSGTERMLWVDCVRMGRKPGEFEIFTPEDVMTEKVMSRRTTHEGDFLQVLELARRAGYPIPKIEILGIEPMTTEQGLELSDPLRERLETYIQEAVKRIA